MKLVNIAIACFLIAGCSHPTTETSVMTKTDSLIIASDSVAANAEASSKILDSVTTVTTEKVHDNIKILTNTITNYEIKVKSTLKVKEVEKIIHDTVYIETKKSFWGRTKTNVSTKSDSTVDQSETIDTTQQ